MAISFQVARNWPSRAGPGKNVDRQARLEESGSTRKLWSRVKTAECVKQIPRQAGRRDGAFAENVLRGGVLFGPRKSMVRAELHAENPLPAEGFGRCLTAVPAKSAGPAKAPREASVTFSILYALYIVRRKKTYMLHITRAQWRGKTPVWAQEQELTRRTP
jgi:hypothetical protein